MNQRQWKKSHSGAEGSLISQSLDAQERIHLLKYRLEVAELKRHRAQQGPRSYRAMGAYRMAQEELAAAERHLVRLNQRIDADRSHFPEGHPVLLTLDNTDQLTKIRHDLHTKRRVYGRWHGITPPSGVPLKGRKWRIKRHERGRPT